jgi:hypothetical protein
MFRTILRTRSARAVTVVMLATTMLPGLGTVARSQSVSAKADATGCQPTASTPVPQPSQAELDAGGLGDLPLAPDSASTW